MPRVVHFEIHADNTNRCVSFYKGVFGWEITKWESPDPEIEYWLVMTVEEGDKVNIPGKEAHGIDGAIIKRNGPAPQEGQPTNSYVCTIDVPDVDVYIRKVQDMGGSVTVPKMSVPKVGYLAYCKDTEGNIFGLMQADENT